MNLNGVRLNSEEIKDELLQHEDITDAVAVVKRSGEDKEYLCAYLTSHRKLTSTELRQRSHEKFAGIHDSFPLCEARKDSFNKRR